MATRDLSYLIDFNVEGAEDLSTAATNMETLANATNGVNEQATLDLDLPPTSEIEDVGTAIGDLGADGGPIDSANEKAGGLSGAFNEMVGALSLVEVATFGADFVLGKYAERQEKLAQIDAFDDAQVKAFADAIRQAGDDVAHLVDSLENTQRITGIEPLGGTVVDITNDLADAGVTADEYFRVLEGGGPSVSAFIDKLEEQGVGQDAVNRIHLVAINNLDNFDAATRDAAASNAVFSESQVSANQALQELLDEQDPMRRFSNEWDLLKESMSDGSIDTTAAANALNTLATELGLTTDQVLELAQADLDEAAEGALAFAQALDSVDFRASELQGATTAFSEFTDGLFAAANEAERREAAFDALAASAEGQALTFNLATEAGRAQSDALEQVARVVDEDLAKAYDSANGSQEAFIAAATQIGDETLARLQDELGLTDEQVNTLRNTLGLTAADYEARFALAGAEEARLQLDLLSGAIEGLPTEIEQTVTQQILAGDFVGARDTVANYYADNPVTLSTEVDETGADSDIQSKVIGTAIDKVAVISTSADTEGADTELDLVALEVRTATIGAVADTATADAQLDAIAAQRRQAVIDAVLGSIPSPSQIISAATGGQGRLVIPLVGRWSTRIEGSRPR